ncbi:hypothetical protein [Clostridium butyricum]|uniref:hypothetical protein n=1 Tax=Clostridium butyricum TaxID=1492 RepID=UPI00325BDB2D
MEFISAEEFLKQEGKVQKVFLDWWKPSVGDLYKWISNSTFEDVQVLNKSAIDTFKYDEFINFKKDCIPLLAEGQLRKYIEDNTNCHIEIIVGISGYVFVLRSKETLKEEKRISVLKCDLLQAYWKVAIQIAESN